MFASMPEKWYMQKRWLLRGNGRHGRFYSNSKYAMLEANIYPYLMIFSNTLIRIANWIQWVSSEFLDLYMYVINTSWLDFDCSMEIMCLLVGLTNKARGYPRSISVCVLTNRCWVPLVGRIIVMRTARMSHSRWTRLYLKLRAKQSCKKMFCSEGVVDGIA